MSQDTLFGDGPLIDPDCRGGKHGSCVGGPCECWCHRHAGYDVNPEEGAAALLRKRGWTVVAPGWLDDTLAGDGRPCPCCTQNVKRYRRKIHSMMVRQMIVLLRAGAADDFVNLPHEARKANVLSGGDVGKARYWGLMEEEQVRRPDGGRAGWWMLTPLGVGWLRGLVTVPKYVYVFDGALLGSDGPPVTVRDALGTKFHYDDLMKGI